MKLKQLFKFGVQAATAFVQANDLNFQKHKAAEEYEAEIKSNQFKNLKGFDIGLLIKCSGCGVSTMGSSHVSDTDKMIYTTCTCNTVHKYAIHIPALPTCIKNETVFVSKTGTLTFLSFDRV